MPYPSGGRLTDKYNNNFRTMNNKKEKKSLYLHETFLTVKIPEIAASSLVRDSDTASPQSRGSIAKVLSKSFSSK